MKMGGIILVFFKCRRNKTYVCVFGLFILFFPILLLISGCVLGNMMSRDRDKASLWINIPEKRYFSFRETGVETAFTIVPSNKRSEYIKRLEHTQYIELGEDEYFELTKKNPEKKYGLAIRAVYLHKGGQFVVIRDYMNDYHVIYFVMGGSFWEMNKEVLVIETDELPNEIFIDYAIAK
jgi:hypothetical protein